MQKSWGGGGWGRSGRGSGRDVGGQGGCKRRIESIVKMHKKVGGWGSDWMSTKNRSYCENARK